MKQDSFVAALLLSVIITASIAARAENREVHTVPKATPNDMTASQVVVPQDYLSNKLKQDLGHGLLGAGLGVVIVGVVLVEIDSWGTIGKAGFISVGSGLAISFAGMFLLGFSRPVHDLQPSRHGATTSALSAGSVAKGSGAKLVYDMYF
ncbi:MAG: hypothetical protein GY854_21995 [Deltaproteobacteria bacterium]|nr:hypothetical protein [Deltaproteobacteria bacterium]